MIKGVSGRGNIASYLLLVISYQRGGGGQFKRRAIVLGNWVDHLLPDMINKSLSKSVISAKLLFRLTGLYVSARLAFLLILERSSRFISSNIRFFFLLLLLFCAICSL